MKIRHSALIVVCAVTVTLGTHAVGVSSQGGTWETTLQPRDLDHDHVTDAFYDTDLNITWLRDADINGRMYWEVADHWAKTLHFGGHTGWRLPATDTCTGYGCSASEMGHLWYTELGNAGGYPNSGPFQNTTYREPGERRPIPKTYWAGQDDWGFTWYGGYQGPGWAPGTTLWAMAVHDGDVGALVPEPGTYTLMLAGVAALALIARLRPH